MSVLAVVEDLKSALLNDISVDATFSESSILYREPRTAEETRGESGERELIYWLPDSSGSIEITHIKGGVPIAYDIQGELTLRVEVVDDESNADRSVLEDRVCAMGDAVIDIVAADPELGLSATWENLEIHPTSWELTGAFLDRPGQGVALNLGFLFRYEGC